MPRKPNTQERRAQIVQALLDTMAEHGYERATIQLIARRAGLTPGLLHYHFKTKAEILNELVKTLDGLARSRYDRFAEQVSSPEERLAAYLQARLGLGDGAAPKAVAAWVMIGAEAVRQLEVRTLYQEALDSELKLIEELVTSSLRSKCKQLANARTLSAGILAFVEGTFQLASAAPAAIPQGSAVQTAICFATRYIDAEPQEHE